MPAMTPWEQTVKNASIILRVVSFTEEELLRLAWRVGRVGFLDEEAPVSIGELIATARGERRAPELGALCVVRPAQADA